MAEPKISAAGNDYTVEVSLQNQGFIPTALRQAQLVKIVRPDTLSMVFPVGMTSVQGVGGRGGRGGRGETPDMEGGGGRGGFPGTEPPGGGRGETPGGGARGGGEGGQAPQPDTSKDKVIIVEPQNRPSVTIDRIGGNETKAVTFRIRLNGIAGTDCTLRYSSTRGGLIEKKIYIGKK